MPPSNKSLTKDDCYTDKTQPRKQQQQEACPAVIIYLSTATSRIPPENWLLYNSLSAEAFVVEAQYSIL